MTWQKQTKYKSGKKEAVAKPKFSDEMILKKFMEDWNKCRDPHPGQREVLKAVFEDKFKYIFYRAGRKGAKTTTGIDIAWRMAHMIPKSVGYLCYPTIAHGTDIVWDERRLQTCDMKDDFLFDKYVKKVDDNRHIVWFENGSFIKLIGTWTQVKGRGTQPDYFICDEFQDCNANYIEAMDPNLGAKDAPCIFLGTPPEKRNHYEEWWERIGSNPAGKTFHFTSYDNTRLPHLKDWLDKKKIELFKANKEDVWLREYMAEFCYSSSNRVLPDAKFIEKDQMARKVSIWPYNERVPVLAISIHKTYFNAIQAILVPNKAIMILDHMTIPQVWDKSFAEMYPLLGEKVKKLQDLCGKKLRNVVWDESESFSDIITGFSKCRTDVKWQDRGTTILREMMVRDKILFSREVADFGLECQNLLMDENQKDIQKNYPNICTLSMMVNEYFSQEKFKIPLLKPFDKYEAFREMGIPYTPSKKRRRKGHNTFRIS